jgi:hypothetical protein
MIKPQDKKSNIKICILYKYNAGCPFVSNITGCPSDNGYDSMFRQQWPIWSQEYRRTAFRQADLFCTHTLGTYAPIIVYSCGQLHALATLCT